MKLGIYLRNMGPQSTRSLIADAARAAEEAGVDDLWVADHLALPPEESEGSDGRYVEALATLAFLAGITERVALAVGVLVVPYRPALLTAKWIASLQELSGERLILGVGVGWLDKEFRALGVDPRRRGAITDATLAFLHDCFAADEVEANGQTFLFRPRPPRPPIVVGGAPPHAISRACASARGGWRRPRTARCWKPASRNSARAWRPPASRRPKSCCCSRCRSSMTRGSRLGSANSPRWA